MQERIVSQSGLPASGARSAHLRDYWKIIRRGRFTVATIFLLALGGTFVKAIWSVPIYKATAVIEVKPEARRILPGQEQWMGTEGGGWIAEEKYFNTQLEVLRSRDVAERTFRRLRLDHHRLFEGVSDPIGAFAKMVEVRAKSETRLVFVSISGPDPKEAKEWVNTLVDVYVKRNIQNAMESFNGIMDEISKGLDTFRGSLEQADTKRLKIAADEELYVPENQQDILRKRLETYNEQFSAASMEIGSLDAELTGLERIRKEGGDLLTLPRCAQDPVVVDLTSQRLEAEKELRRIGTEKKPGHPEYVSKLADLAKINKNLEDQVARVLEKLQTQRRLKVGEAESLHEQIRKTEAESFRVQQAMGSYDISKNDADAKKKVYDVVAETMERLSVGAQLITMNNNLSVLDSAIQPRIPVKPRKKLMLALGGLLGLLTGLAAVLFMDYLDNTVRSTDDIEQFLGLSILAIVPKRKEANSHAVKEAFQSLRTSILFSSHNREKKILLIASAGPQEGKSNTTASLARTFASTGDKVVVIDCDLRRPTQHVHMNVAREPGLTNYLLEGRLDDVGRYLQPTDVETLKLMPCGPIPPNPPELIGLPKFRELLAELKRTHDWVIIDSPPVVSLSDTLLLASMAELVAIVIKHNENDRDLILRSIKQLREINANIIGAVLNSLDVSKGSGDYYYSGYYYYGESAGKGGKKQRTTRKKKDPEVPRPGERVAL